MCIYIYIYIEREIRTYTYLCIMIVITIIAHYIYIYTNIHTCIHIYKGLDLRDEEARHRQDPPLADGLAGQHLLVYMYI